MPIQQTPATREDPRQRRSRHRLSEAFLSLVSERDYRDISVVDICERAMVHRTTFYAHFEDKDALFRYVLEEEIRLAARSRPEAAADQGFWGALREELAIALRFCNGHRALYLTGMISGGYTEMRAVEDHLSQRIKKIVLDNCPDEPAYMAEMTSRFYTGGLMNVARWWMVNNIPLSEEELLELMIRLLPRQWVKE